MRSHSGFYVADALLKKDERVAVDMVEKLPVPFGLVRFGVAPDHPEVRDGAERALRVTLRQPDRITPTERLATRQGCCVRSKT